jgi:hypothetical protein
MPAFTQRHYIAVAKLLHENDMRLTHCEQAMVPALSLAWHNGAERRHSNIYNDFVTLFLNDNEKFDEARFSKACHNLNTTE